MRRWLTGLLALAFVAGGARAQSERERDLQRMEQERAELQRARAEMEQKLAELRSQQAELYKRLKDETAQLCGSGEEFEVAFVQPPASLELCFKDGLYRWVCHRHANDNRFRGARRRDESSLIARRDLAQPDGTHREQLLHLPLEDRRHVVVSRWMRECRTHRRDHVSQLSGLWGNGHRGTL